MTFRKSGTAVRLRNGKLSAMTPGAAPAQAPGGVLTIIEPMNQRIYQRVGTGRLVPASGSFTGTVSQVQMRAVPVGTPLTDTSAAWVDVPTDTVAKTFAGTPYVQQGGMYVWQARDKANPATAKTGTNIFGVGMFCLDWGQSNTVNHFTTPADYPSGAKTAFQYTNGGYHRVGNIAIPDQPNLLWGPGYGNGPTNDGGTVCDGPVYFANMMTAELGIPVCLITGPGTWIGQPISYWFNGNQGWADIVAIVNAIGGDFELANLYQGESNAASSSYSDMQNAWNTITSQFYNLTGRDATNLKLGMVSLGPGNYGTKDAGQFGRMRVNQITYATSTAGWYYAAGIHDGSTDDDTVHINGRSHAKLGRREARSALNQYGIGPSGAGPRASTATRSGAVITGKVVHAGGTKLTDGAGGNGSALTGFTVKVNGVAATISATAITGVDTYALTLSAAPASTDTVTLEYAQGDVPHGAYVAAGVDPVLTKGHTTFVPASCLYDDVATPNSTIGSPLRPFAAITVTGG